MRGKASLGLRAAVEAALRNRGGGDVPALGPRLELLVEAGADSSRIGGTDDTSIRSRLDRLLGWRRRIRDEHPHNVALVDTTLVAAVHRLTLADPPRVTAGTLLDLATFARAVVLYDRLLVLPGATDAAMELNAALGSTIVHPLPVRPTVDEYGALTGVGAVLGNMFSSTMTELDLVLRAGSGSALRQDAKAIAEGWSTLLGRRISPRMALNGTLDEGRHWDSDGPGLVHRLTELERPVRRGDRVIETASRHPALFAALHSDQELRDFVSECNHRSYFNLRLAHALEVPYLPSVTRLPFRSRLYQSAAFANQRLLLHQEVDQRFYHLPDRLDLPLPVYLVIALRRAGRPADLLAELAELRGGGKPLRERRVEYEHALLTGESPELVERLRTAVTTEVTRQGVKVGDLAPVALGASAALAAATSTSTALMISLIGVLQSLGSTNADRVNALRDRLLRPVEWFLSSSTGTARAITTTSGDIQRLWEIDREDSGWLVKRLSTLGELGPS